MKVEKIIPEKWTEPSVAKVLHKRFCSPEWAFLTSVRNQTGYSREVRTADALAMNLYPSRGMEVNGFEIKVSRSDVLHELRQPNKSEEIQRFCHKWWLVVSDKDFVKEGELPITWGLITVESGSVKIIKQAPELKPTPFTNTFVAAILRNVTEGFVHPEDVEQRMDHAREMAKANMGHEFHQYANLKKLVEDFEKASGIELGIGWRYKDGEKIGKAVKFVMEGKDTMRREAEYALRNVTTVVEDLKKLVKEFS